MQLVIRPMLDPRNEIDVTHELVKAVAEELWRRYGGNDVLNWMEAQWHIEALFERGSPVRVLPLAEQTPAVPSRPDPGTNYTGARRAGRAGKARSAPRRAGVKGVLGPV